jgi:hypothetical protein
MEGQEGRVRMNVNINAKGGTQWEVTAEYATPELTKKALSEAIDAVRSVIKEKNLTEVTG